MKILIAHASNYDYLTELYQPLKQSALQKEHTIVFPHDEENKEIETTSQLRDADLLIAEVSHPSTGAGIEIGLAQAANIPTPFLYRKGVTPSSALKFCKGTVVAYADSDDLIAQIRAHLEPLSP